MNLWKWISNLWKRKKHSHEESVTPEISPKKGNTGHTKELQTPPPEPPDILEDNVLTCIEVLCKNVYPEILSMMEQKQYREAAERCKELSESTPDWRLHSLRARCYKLLGKTPELDRCLTAALELDPDNILILRARCPTVSTTNRYRRHLGDLTRLMELDPENRDFYLVSRAYRYHWTGDDDAARQDLRAVESREARRSVDFFYLWKQFFSEPPPT